MALSWDHVEVVTREYLPLHVVLLHETVLYPRSRCLRSDGIDTSYVGLLVSPSHDPLEGAAFAVPDMNDKLIGTLYGSVHILSIKITCLPRGARPARTIVIERGQLFDHPHLKVVGIESWAKGAGEICGKARDSGNTLLLKCNDLPACLGGRQYPLPIERAHILMRVMFLFGRHERHRQVGFSVNGPVPFSFPA